LIGLVINLLLTITIVGRVHDVFVGIGSAHRELQSLYRMMQLIEELAPDSPLLQSIRSSIASPQASATTAIERLRRRMGLAGIQRNPLFFLVYWVLQLFVLWDVRVLESLERWKVRFGTHIATWVSALGQFEALISAATLADENPDWAYPVWKDDRTRNLSVEQLGHPLLAPSARVSNDLRIDESHPLLLVTGSNMAGKSTLLRSLGINTLLARTGSPVCCKQWIGPNAELASSIRVQDSLQDGVSFFMAELKRLRTIVDFTHSSLDRSPRGCIVLLDEILQGTNSRERQIAVESVLQQLVQLQALVLASTHDLELANVPSLTSIAQIVHFREYFESVDGTEKMKFDYIMRPGVTPTTNALKLLELVGLASSR
jgi:DNA mismatch repair ATPase MutS